MKVTILGSGSRGNAMLISAARTMIMVDAGFPYRTLKRRAEAAGLDLSNVSAVVLTHEHNDHACAAMQVAVKAGCPVYGSLGTIRGLGPKDKRVTIQEVAHRESVEIGPFTLGACRVSHDAHDPMALAVIGPRGERLAVAYDLGRANPLASALQTSDRCAPQEIASRRRRPGP